MWTGDKAFYDLLKMAGLHKENLQPFVDKYYKKYNTLDITGFPFRAQMQPLFDFSQIEREYGINAMATYVDLDSPGTPISFDGAVLATGQIPRMKKNAAFSESDFRKMIADNALNPAGVTGASMLKVHEVIEKLVSSHANAMTYQRHQMVSNGQFELHEDNNASGIQGLIYKANIPADNVVALAGNARWWTDAEQTTEGTASDPIKDLQELAKKARKRGSAFRWEVDQLTLDATLAHSKVRTAIGYFMYPMAATPDAALSFANASREEALLQGLTGLLKFPIKPIDSISRVDRYDPTQRKIVGVEMRSFAENTWALVPDGRLGETLVVQPIKVGEAASFADFLGGRLLLTIDYEVRRKVQYFETEMTALAVPDKPKYMYLLKVAEAEADTGGGEGGGIEGASGVATIVVFDTEHSKPDVISALNAIDVKTAGNIGDTALLNRIGGLSDEQKLQLQEVLEGDSQ